MADNGTITESIRTGYQLKIAWEVTSQSVANNTSSVTVKVQLVSTGSSYTINSTASKSGSLTINGTKYTFSFTAGLSGNQTKTIFSKPVTIAHNADGTKTCSFSATCGINVTLSGTYYGNVTASGSGTFDTIARASTISSVTSSVAVNGTNEVTVSISRKASSFTHTVVFSFGSYSKTTTGVGTSTSYAIPTSWLNAIPSATSGTAKVTVTTYSGSTKIGSAVSKNFTLTVPSTVVPSISAVTMSEAESDIAAKFGGYVQNKSKLAVKITAAGNLSSTIKAYKTTIQGTPYTGASFTSGFLKNSGTSTVTITVTDSRGRTASTTRSLTVIAYAAPKITTFQGYRCLANGTENYDGTYLSAAVNFSISPVSDKNTKSYKLEYKLQSATTWTTLTSGSVYALNSTIVSSNGPFGADNTFDIRLSVTDYFGTITSTFDLPTAFTLLDFNKSGRGIAFGKVSELDEGIEFALPTVFSHAETPSSPIYLQNGQDFNDILEPGFYAIPNTAVSATLLNKPWTTTATGGLYVLVEGDGMGKMQIAHRLAKGEGEIYERSYYQSAWGPWCRVYGGNGRILWTGGYYMTEGHKVTLSEKVSDQVSGIVIVFSRYANGAAVDTNFSCHYIPKALVAAKPGVGHLLIMGATPTFELMAAKYLYINDETIAGHASNSLAGTSTTTGITYANNAFVMRYVIGV